MAAVNLTSGDFDDKVKTGWAMVDFWAEWSIPTVILYENGVEKGRQVGYAGKQGYLNLLASVKNL